MANMHYKGMTFLRYLVCEFSNNDKPLRLSVVVVETLLSWFLLIICSSTANQQLAGFNIRGQLKLFDPGTKLYNSIYTKGLE